MQQTSQSKGSQPRPSLALSCAWWVACFGSSVWRNLATWPVAWAKGPAEHCLLSLVIPQGRRMSVTAEPAELCCPSHLS